MGSVINITPQSYSEYQNVENWGGEYAKREIEKHKNSEVIDHPDGSITEDKLSTEISKKISDAINSAAEANEKSDIARSTSDAAKNIAELARNDSEGALNTSLDAYVKADSAALVAEQAKERAEGAQVTADVAREEIIGVLSELEAAQSETDAIGERVSVLETNVGDIDAALDAILSIQNTLIGGETV